MKVKIVFYTFIAALGVMYPKKLGIPAPPPIPKNPVSDMLDLEETQEEIAIRAERRLREHGFSDELITGALVNAYAESELNVDAVGKAGERGIFQLHPQGLGHGMSIDEMRDIRASVDRVARAIKKNKKIMKLEKAGATAEAHTAAFCVEIERPDKKHSKAKSRVRLMKKMLIN